MYSDRERIAHVVRRLGIGAHPWLVEELEGVDEAIARLIEVPDEPAEPPRIDPPRTWDDVDYEVLSAELVPWWLDTIGSGTQPLVERLTWFWHDHFAVGGAKVDHSYVLWEHHRRVRSLATGNFAELLRAVATDAAMLWYLDGAQNAVGAPNENFGREVMELHTLGVGNYTQTDVTEISRCFTGWVVNEPDDDGGFWYEAGPWSGVFDPDRFDSGVKRVLGRTGRFDLDDALGILLERPETGRHVAASLYEELVGLVPPPATVQRLGVRFARDYDIMGLVEDIVADPAFTSDEAIRAKIRTPLEKAATVLQGLPGGDDASGEWLFWMLDGLHYLPLHPPNPAGFPAGAALLDPARLLGSFDLLNLVANLDEEGAPTVDPLRALGLYDVSDQTRTLIERFPRPGLQLGLAFGSPEFQVV